MSETPQRISDELALAEKLRENWKEIEENVRKETASLEAEYTRVRNRQKNRQKLGGVCAFAGLVSFGFFSIFDFVWALIPCAIFLVAFGILIHDTSNIVWRFNDRVNRVLYPKIFALFGLQALKVERSWEIAWLLDASELMTRPRNKVTIDDIVRTSWKGKQLLLSELDIDHVRGSGRRRNTEEVFCGYFVAFDIGKNLSGKTFISAGSDTSGYGHRSFWNSVRGHGAQKTVLEWNAFEDLLHVATDNPVEARYILSTSFMADLYDWWKDRSSKIHGAGNSIRAPRLSFVGSRLYILFPDNRIQINKTVESITTAELQAYAMTIATPLMHVLHLIEDVET